MATAAFVDVTKLSDGDLGILIRRAIFEVSNRNGVNSLLKNFVKEVEDRDQKVYLNEYTEVLNGGNFKHVMDVHVTKEGKSKNIVEARKIAQEQILQTLFDIEVE